MEHGMYDAAHPDIFDAVVQIVEELGLYKEEINKQNGKIVVLTGTSLLSWGERIIIQITGKGSKTKVTVSSTPKAQLFDWGKSRKNEKGIIKRLNTLFGR